MDENEHKRNKSGEPTTAEDMNTNVTDKVHKIDKFHITNEKNNV